MTNKYFRIYLIGAALALLVGIVSVGAALAYTSPTTTLFPSIGFGGLQLLRGPNTSQFVLIDMSDATSNETYQLPSVSGRDGDFFLVKRIDNNENYDLFINSASGESLEGVVDNSVLIPRPIGDGYPSGRILIADVETNTWWILNTN